MVAGLNYEAANAPPAAPGITLTAAPYGGWTQIPEARAAYYNGVTYFGYVNGSNGNVEVRSYNHATEITSAATVIKTALGVDTHNAPALLVRDSDKKIVVAYSGHVGSTLWVRISTNAEDISAFGSEITAESGGEHTYPILLQRLAETNDPLYLFYRDNHGSGTRLAYVKSTDGGVTWGSQVAVWDANLGSYWKITTDGQWRIDFAVTDGNPDNASSKIYHFYADATDYHQSDGTVLVGSQPFGPSQVTEVYDGAGPAWPTDIILNGSNLPRIVYSVSLGGDSSYRFARWTGSAWNLSTIVSAGADIVDPAPVATLDAVVLTDCHLVKKVAGNWELYRYERSSDTVDTWDGGTAVTTSSGFDNIYPVKVHNHPAGELGILWLYGDYAGAEISFDMGIRGVEA